MRKSTWNSGGYGGTFFQWIFANKAGPYGSWGNGSAMRVSPIAWACRTLDEVLMEGARSAAVTHNHPEGVKGAKRTVLGTRTPHWTNCRLRKAPGNGDADLATNATPLVDEFA